VSRELIEAFDYILAMEPAHLRTMSFYSSQAKMKSTLLKSFIEKNPKKQTIKDPVGQPLRLHRDCYKELERSIRGFIKFLADGR
jgi:protein-tyrosine-phosphatase